MKRRTRRQWYEYHLEQSQRAARSAVMSRFSAVVERAEQGLKNASTQLETAKKHEPFLSSILAFFGIDTSHHSLHVQPIQTKVNQCQKQLSEILEQRRAEIIEAESQGAEQYRAEHALRKEKLHAWEEGAAQRAHEHRIRYLERSPRIRSAARYLKSILIKEQAQDGYVKCFYCGAVISDLSSHLEHKKPVSRGGDNRRGNVVLACASCNLSKGKKTDKEFLRTRETDNL